MSFDPTEPEGQRARTPAALSHAIIDLLAGVTRAMHASEIAQRLGVRDRTRLRDALDKLVDDGILLPRAGQRFRLAPGAAPQAEPPREKKGLGETRPRRAATLVEGIVHVNPKGFAFVRAGADTEALYIPPDAVGSAMHGDRVAARVVARSRRGREGEIVSVLERRLKRVVGTIAGREGQRYLEPDDARVRGPIQIVEERVPASPGLAGVVEITRYPEDNREHPQGALLEVLGEPGEPDVEVRKVLAAHAIDEEHPPEAVREAAAFGKAVDPAELARREDLTHLPLVTIDPYNARDHDDAVWATRDDDGNYEAWIAIADVSHYVTPKSALDTEALERGCSVYLPDRAVPMLPSALSGVLCSLLAGEERLCLCVHIELDAVGTVRRSRIIEGRMRSHAYLTYNAVGRALGFTTLPEPDPAAEAMRDELRVLWDLAMLLRKKRMRRGALDLDVPEAEIAIDPETRLPVKIVQREHDPGVRKAYRLVEELMLLANETVARFCLDRDLPAIYRVHAAPEPEKLVRLAEACAVLGVEFDPEDGTDPLKMSRFLRKAAAHPRREIIHMLLLRTLAQACYDPTNIGHFGLASGAYLHFTSPIRRYPDLWVHRAVRCTLRGQEPPMDEEALRRAALHASEKERNAMEAEREVADVYRAILMQTHIGESFEGSVSSITPIGVWVRLNDPFVDVLVPLDALGNDAYEVDDNGLSASGSRSGESITLGDKLTLVIEDVSLTRRLVFGRRLVAEGRRRRDQKKSKGNAKAKSQLKPQRRRPIKQHKRAQPNRGKRRGR